MHWYFPSWNGDVRIRATDDALHTVMTIIEPTRYELEVLGDCQNVFRAKKWLHASAKLWKETGDPKRQEVTLEATLLEVGSILIGRLKPGVATLTAVIDEEGRVDAMGSAEPGFAKWIAQALRGDGDAIPAEVTVRDKEGYAARQAEHRRQKPEAQAQAKQEKEDAEKTARAEEAERRSREKAAEAKRKEEEKRKAEAEKKRKAEAEKKRKAEEDRKRRERAARERAATTVKRPTPCCPGQVPAVVGPAQEVLLRFCTPEQRAQWLRERRMVVEGGLSGHRYLLAHRHSATAQKIGKIAYDLDDEAAMHFHDWTVPPEEEILAAKLCLEHREHWVRNEATTFQDWMRDEGFYQRTGAGALPATRMKFKNPFGDGGDGMADSTATSYFGQQAMAALQRHKRS